MVGLGALFVLLLASVAYLGLSASSFVEETQPFLLDFTADFARNWEVATVEARMTDALATNLRTPQGRNVMSQLKQLGAFKGGHEFESRHYSSGTDGKRAEIAFDGRFEHADVVVTIVVERRDGVVKVDGFHIALDDGVQPQSDARDA